MGLEEKIRKDIVLINSKISSFKNKDEICSKPSFFAFEAK